MIDGVTVLRKENLLPPVVIIKLKFEVGSSSVAELQPADLDVTEFLSVSTAYDANDDVSLPLMLSDSGEIKSTDTDGSPADMVEDAILYFSVVAVK